MSKRVRLWREAYREFSNEPMVLHNDNQSANRTLQPAFGRILSPDYNDMVRRGAQIRLRDNIPDTALFPLRS